MRLLYIICYRDQIQSNNYTKKDVPILEIFISNLGRAKLVKLSIYKLIANFCLALLNLKEFI